MLGANKELGGKSAADKTQRSQKIEGAVKAKVNFDIKMILDPLT